MENNIKVIVFNGPPSSGKDEICKMLLEEGDSIYHKIFKEHLFQCVFVLFAINPERFMELYDNRDTKELPTEELRGYSPRSAMIFVSETVIKPNFGKDYFGIETAKNLESGLNVFSDGGFEEELNPVYEKCQGQMMIVQVHREGYNFNSDSRKYVESFKDVPILKLYNNGTLEELREKSVEVKNNFLASLK